MGRIKGRNIILYDKEKTGVDGFNRPTYEEVPIEVENVLISTPTDQEITDTLNLTGKRVSYVLGIPKVDDNTWTGRRVELPEDFPQGKYRVIGHPVGGQEDLIPLDWNKKALVERYE